MSAFMDRSYRIGSDGQTVLCDAIAGRADIDAMRDAIAWRREQLSHVGLDADAVLTLRALMKIDDLLAATAPAEHAVLTLSRPQALMLCEIVGAYVTARDVDSYQAPEERNRIACMRGLSGPLIDCCCELAAAEDEARELLLPA